VRRRELASMRRIPTVQTINPPVQGPDVFLAIPSCPPPPRLSLPAPLISSSAFITYPRHTRSLPHTLRLFARPAHCSSLPYRLGTLLADTVSASDFFQLSHLGPVRLSHTCCLHILDPPSTTRHAHFPTSAATTMGFFEKLQASESCNHAPDAREVK
jgi:hypothetical protein